MLSDKIIVVTGGAGLVGQAFCRAISQAHGVAVVADINYEKAKNVAEEIRQLGGKATAYLLDINSKDSILAMICSIEKCHGRIDAVVNNAYPRNSMFGTKVEEVNYEDFCMNVNLHLGGYFLVSQQFAIYFSKASGGNIVNMSSIYGYIAPKFEVYSGSEMTMPVEYAATKAAVRHLTRYFAQYYKKDRVRVNTISPGGISDKQPKEFLKRYNEKCGSKGMLSVDDITGTLLYLLSDASKYVTGQEVVIDDGYSL